MFAVCIIVSIALLLLATNVSSSSPNILFILSDDTGWNDVSFHGSLQIPTPTMDALASNGITLNNYYVNPVCSPTRASIMSGRSMIHHGIQTPFDHGNDASGLNLSYTLFPEQLKQHFNYSTYMIGKWHLGMKTKDYLPSSRGFDKFYGFYLGCSDYWKHYGDVDDNGEAGLDLHEGGIELNIPPGEDVPLYNTASQYSTTLYGKKAIEWIDLHAKTKPNVPWYMYLSFQGTHSGNNKFVQAPAKKIEKFKSISPDETCGQYDVCTTTPTCTHQAMRKTCAATLSVVDDAISDIVETLKATGMYENTIIVYSSDNGGPPNGTNNNMMNNWPLRSGKGSTWEGGIRAAGFIHAPHILKRTGISNDLFHVTDWYKSLFRAAAGDGPSQKISMKPNEVEWKKGDGIDNWAVLASSESEKVSSARTEIIIVAQADGSVSKTNAIRVGDMKLLWSPNLLYTNTLWYFPPGSPKYDYTVKCGDPPKDVSDNLCETENNPCLYNITADPCEHFNLAKSMPQIVAHLKEKIAGYKKTTVLPWKQFARSDKRSLPSNHGKLVKIVPNLFKGGASEYNGVWSPWLTPEESSKFYPEYYVGPGY
jgi:arylsulfatase A-like enzyme